jgi:hypothetical protein
MPDLPKLALRAFSEDDGPVLMDLFGAPEVARWVLPAGRTQAHSEAECAARARAGAAHWRAHGFGPWIVSERGRTVACGGLGLRLLDGCPELELAWAVIHWRSRPQGARGWRSPSAAPTTSPRGG